MNEEIQNKIPELESLLFHFGNPLSLKRIASMLKIKEEECIELVSFLEGRMRENISSGLMVVRNGDEVQLATKPEYQHISGKIVEEEFKEQLTPAALETLSLIAYLGPVSRPTIDYIRGVNSSFIVRNLLIRGLIGREQGTERKNTYEYSVTFDFLKHMGIGNVSELPEYEKYKQIFEDYERQEFQNREGEGQLIPPIPSMQSNEVVQQQEQNDIPHQ